MPKPYVRSTNRGHCSVEQLQSALEAVRSGIKIREVGRAFGFAESTTRLRLKTGIIQPSPPGRKPVFTEQQEQELAKHVLTLTKIFHGTAPIELLRLAFGYAEANSIKHNFDVSSKMSGKDLLGKNK
ncbi:hypothetical protein PR048_030544 [Dryococelus australis]|uniref:HTH psq-type domain-containing protein n=1 Tax=Dryococelus australis TaxID=614101 RepID=A0ABQ9G9Q9_9NEOP|nr:hypothetical protein PR048_030544 [Dryococelus australis]